MSRVLNKYVKTGIVVLISGLTMSLGNLTAFAANTPTLTQQINAGVLSTDILDGSHVTVASPTAAMSTKNFSSTCLSGGNASTGSLGTTSQRVYVINPSGADNGWTLSIAATAGPTAQWTNAANDKYDFNDSATAGCTDGADTDTKSGQLTINPSSSTLTLDCTSCTNTGITKGSSTAFSEGTVDSVTLLSAGPTADKVWEGYLTGIALSQTIPGDTPAGAYSLNLTLTAVAL